MKYQIKSHDSFNHTVNVAICSDAGDINTARIFPITLMFKASVAELEAQITECWTLYNHELQARLNLSTILLEYVSNSIGVDVNIPDPIELQTAIDMMVDSTGTTGIEVL